MFNNIYNTVNHISVIHKNNNIISLNKLSLSFISNSDFKKKVEVSVKKFEDEIEEMLKIDKNTIFMLFSLRCSFSTIEKDLLKEISHCCAITEVLNLKLIFKL